MTNKNMELWDSVKTTHSSALKKVSYGSRKFSAIDAYSQIRAATEQWGPMGGLWRVESERVDSPDKYLILKVTLYYPSEGSIPSTIGDYNTQKVATLHQYGSANWNDDDGYKKALTDGITKCLSYLGFNADVFLGQWDDNKYVAAQKKKEAAKEKDARISPHGELTGCQDEVRTLINSLPMDSRSSAEIYLDEMVKTEVNWFKFRDMLLKKHEDLEVSRA